MTAEQPGDNTSEADVMWQSMAVGFKQPVFWIGLVVLLAGIQTGYLYLGLVLGLPTIALGAKHGIDELDSEVTA